MGTIALFNDLIVITFRSDQTHVHDALIQEILHYVCLKGAEDVARTEMNPDGSLIGILLNGFIIKGGKMIAFLFIFRFSFPNSSQCQFHIFTLSALRLFT